MWKPIVPELYRIAYHSGTGTRFVFLKNLTVGHGGCTSSFAKLDDYFSKNDKQFYTKEVEEKRDHTKHKPHNENMTTTKHHITHVALIDPHVRDSHPTVAPKEGSNKGEGNR